MGPIQICRGVVSGVTPENQEGLDRSGLESGGEIPDRGGRRGKSRLNKEGSADGPKGRVDREAEGLDGGWLPAPNEQDGGTGICQKIGCTFTNPGGIHALRQREVGGSRQGPA